MSAALLDFGVLMRGQQAEAGHVGKGFIQARTLRTTSARQTYKRKTEDVDTEPDTDHEGFDVASNHAPVETQKCIRREKTGTDWQTVLNPLEYDVEQRSKQTRGSH